MVKMGQFVESGAGKQNYLMDLVVSMVIYCLVYRVSMICLKLVNFLA